MVIRLSTCKSASARTSRWARMRRLSGPFGAPQLINGFARNLNAFGVSKELRHRQTRANRVSSRHEFGLPSRDRRQALCPNLREMTCVLRTVASRWPECTPEAGDYRETEVELRSGALALTALFRIRLTGAAARKVLRRGSSGANESAKQ